MPDPESPSPTSVPPAAAPVVPTAKVEPQSGVPGAPAKPVTETPPKTPAVPDLDPSTRIEIPKKDGSGFQVATLQELADSYLEPKGESDPDQAAKFKAFEEAVTKNDPTAAHALLDLYMPRAAETVDKGAAGTDADRVAILEQQLAEIKTSLDSQRPVVREIEEARIHSGVKSLIEQQKDKLPYLAKDAGISARMVTAKLAEYRQAATSQLGITEEQFNTHPRRQAILAAAFLDCERQLKGVADRFKGFDPAATVKPPAGTVAATVVDDQASPGAGHVPARYRMVNGQLVDTLGQNMQQAGHGPMEAIPSTPLASEPSGSAVGAETGAPVPGAHTPDQLRANMRKRMQEITTE